jgi:hypothetical protein
MLHLIGVAFRCGVQAAKRTLLSSSARRFSNSVFCPSDKPKSRMSQAAAQRTLMAMVGASRSNEGLARLLGSGQ